MARHRIVLGKTNRAIAKQGVDRAPDGYVLELREPRRNDAQNAALWSLLSQVQKQRPIHHGIRMTTDTYKAVFLAALGAELAMLPNLEGDGFIPYGNRSSELTKGEFANLLTVILAWTAREGITVEHFDEESSTKAAGVANNSPAGVLA